MRLNTPLRMSSHSVTLIIHTGFPEPGKTTVFDRSQTIDLESEPLHGGALLKMLVVSIDPYMRRRMQSANSLDSFVSFTCVSYRTTVLTFLHSHHSRSGNRECPARPAHSTGNLILRTLLGSRTAASGWFSGARTQL